MGEHVLDPLRDHLRARKQPVPPKPSYNYGAEEGQRKPLKEYRPTDAAVKGDGADVQSVTQPGSSGGGGDDKESRDSDVQPNTPMLSTNIKSVADKEDTGTDDDASQDLGTKNKRPEASANVNANASTRLAVVVHPLRNSNEADVDEQVGFQERENDRYQNFVASMRTNLSHQRSSAPGVSRFVQPSVANAASWRDQRLRFTRVNDLHTTEGDPDQEEPLLTPQDIRNSFQD